MGTGRGRSPHRVVWPAVAAVMSPSMVDSPAKPDWRPSSAGTIETDLAQLWREIAQEGAVSRATMCNLVVVAECPKTVTDLIGFCGDIPIAPTARRHPARTIMVGYTPSCRDEAPPQGAAVAVLTFGDAPNRYGVELIAVHTTCGEES